MNNHKKIKIENSDSLLQIIKKIEKTLKNTNYDEFFLEINDNDTLKNYLNLKILTSKFAWKKISIITQDKEIRKLGEKLGIKYYCKSDEIEFEERFSKSNVLKHNFSFFEYLNYEIKRFFLKIAFLITKKAKKTYKKNKYNEYSHIFLLAIWLILSFSLLSFIFYFAVSKTYIYISPELSVKTVSRNISYNEKDNNTIFDNKNVIKINPISINSNLSFSFNVSSIDPASSQNAYWIVEVINELSTEQIFKPNTRFVTEDGLVYRSKDWLKVPPSRKSADWQLQIGNMDATLIADLNDNSGKIMWKRWNIGTWVILTIPWLKFNRDKIYAKTKEIFKWWNEPKDHVLTKDEYDKFISLFNEKIRTKALNELKEKINNMNIAWSSNFKIIPINNILNYNIGEIKSQKWIKIWDKTETVTLEWTWTLSTFVFDKSATIFYLRSILNENILTGTEKLIWINEDSLRITNILSQNNSPFLMKATTELDSTISYNFEDKTNNLTRKLKNLIANTTEKEATSILLNDPNIANVKMKFSPFWLTRVSNNPDNIEFIIEK